MSLMRILWGILTFSILGGVIALSLWGIPAPTTRVEKPLSDDLLAP